MKTKEIIAAIIILILWIGFTTQKIEAGKGDEVLWTVAYLILVGITVVYVIMIKQTDRTIKVSTVIKKGENFSEKNMIPIYRRLWFSNKMKIKASFQNLPKTEGIQKIIGWSINGHHHQTSIRLCVRKSNNNYSFFLYCYIRGNRVQRMIYQSKLPLINCKIENKRDHFLCTVYHQSGKRTTHKISIYPKLAPSFFQYTLWPYFEQDGKNKDGANEDIFFTINVFR